MGESDKPKFLGRVASWSHWMLAISVTFMTLRCCVKNEIRQQVGRKPTDDDLKSHSAVSYMSRIYDYTIPDFDYRSLATEIKYSFPENLCRLVT